MRRPDAPVRGTALDRLLELDADERFDLEALNVIPWVEIAREVREDGARRRDVRSKVSELLPRVLQETNDPLSAGSLLRSRVLDWYHRSPGDADWLAQMPSRWGGLFADSREVGGRLHRWIVPRLQQNVPAPPVAHPLSRLLGRSPPPARSVQAPERTPAQTWTAEVAQSLLDDLAAHRRSSVGRVSLVRLSELAGRRSLETVNEALAALFSAPPTGPFVVLHPNRYPDCDLVTIRPPPRGATGAALSYVLHVTSVTSPRAPVHGTGPVEDIVAASSDLMGSEEGSDDPWAREERSSDEWRKELTSFHRQKRHLPSPPKDLRRSPSYRALRSLVFEDPAARKLFLQVKWRGRPQGLLLLAALLAEGSFAPEATTDYEYLDSELGDLERGDPDRHPDPPRWEFPSGVVVREGSFQSGYRYRWEPRGSTPPVGGPPPSSI